MAIDLGRTARAFLAGQESRRKRSEGAMDDAIKIAQLKDMGYDYNPSTRALIQNPDYLSTKGLEREILKTKLDPNYEANKAAIREKAIINARKESMFGANNSAPRMFGGSNTNDSSGDQQPFIYDPISGTQKSNPDYLNPLAKARLNEIESKKQDEINAQKNKEDMLRQDAESQLSAIQEAKKGKKYFGMMGNLPTSAAPSTYLSFGAEYGPRKVWENNTNKLLSGRIIDLMNKMKSASKTGATGFGQLNRSELQLIQNASNVLSKDLTPDDAEKYLNQLEGVYNKVLGNSNMKSFSSPEEADAAGLPSGTIVLVGNRKYKV